MQINWKQKLTSRKFWAAVVTFVTALLAAFGVSDITVGQVTAVITASAAMIAYIIGEGFVDAARLQSSDVSDSADNSETVKK